MTYLSGKALLISLIMACLFPLAISAQTNPTIHILESTQNPKGTIPIITAGEVVLHWTATGDDYYLGRATGYDLRYMPANLGPIDTEAKWNQATQCIGEPTPSVNGRADSMIVAGLVPGNGYYFCIRAFDEVMNYSSLSNSPLRYADDVPSEFIPGDVNNSGRVDGMDIVYFVNYLKGGPFPPQPLLRADCDGSCDVSGIDVMYLLNYLLGWGNPPIRGNCLIAPQSSTVGSSVGR
jgi:hypothetical protein